MQGFVSHLLTDPESDPCELVKQRRKLSQRQDACVGRSEEDVSRADERQAACSRDPPPSPPVDDQEDVELKRECNRFSFARVDERTEPSDPLTVRRELELQPIRPPARKIR